MQPFLRNARRAIVFTAVEVVGLILWLTLAGGGTRYEFAVLPLLVLDAFLIGEHVLTWRAVNGLAPIPIVAIVGFSTIETVIWGTWLALAANPVVATVFLFGALWLEHSISDNVLKGRPFLDDLFRLRVVGFTAVETASCSLWLFFAVHGPLAAAAIASAVLSGVASVVILSIGSLVEHSLALREAES